MNILWFFYAILFHIQLYLSYTYMCTSQNNHYIPFELNWIPMGSLDNTYTWNVTDFIGTACTYTDTYFDKSLTHILADVSIEERYWI